MSPACIGCGTGTGTGLLFSSSRNPKPKRLPFLPPFSLPAAVETAVGVSRAPDRLDPVEEEEELAILALLPVGSVVDLDLSRIDFCFCKNLGSLDVVVGVGVDMFVDDDGSWCCD